MNNNKTFTIVIITVILTFIIIFGLTTFEFPEKRVLTIEELLLLNYENPPTNESYIYNGFSFVYNAGTWYTQIQSTKDTKYTLSYHFGPKQLENIPITGNPSMNFFNEKIYITFDPITENQQYVALAALEVGLGLSKVFDITPIAACTVNETEACATRPINTCNGEISTIYLKLADEPSIVWNNKCVTISGNELDLVKSGEKFLYKLFNIME